MRTFFLSVLCLFAAAFSGRAQVYDYVVAKDGTGNFTSVGAAMDAIVAAGVTSRKTVFVKKGVYQEKVFLGNRWSEVNNIVSLVGENVDSVVIVWDDYSGKSIPYPGKTTNINADGTTCPTLTVTGPEFYMENITVKNPSTSAQAIALYQTKDKQVLKNCKILGNQDTHRTKKGRRYFYYKCMVEGGVDFIYAGGTCMFYQCRINSNRGGWLTAPEDITYMATMSNGKTLRYGFFFRDCDLTSTGLGASTCCLGRPWGPECGSVFIRCRLGNHIKATGWETMGSETYKTASFYEFQSMNADGSALKDVSSRVSWSGQLLEADVDKYMKLNTIWAAISSNPFDALSMVQAPAPVGALTVNGQDLSWNAVSGVKGYVVYANGSVVGITATPSFRDSIVRADAPVYQVRSVGPHGNLSVWNGETDDVTASSLSAVLNGNVTAVKPIETTGRTVVVRNGFLQLGAPCDFALYDLNGRKILECKQMSSCDLSSMPKGLYLLSGTDADRSFFSTKINL